ncbi:SpoIIE family protein phosphatase [Streptomyces noursei]
MFALQVLVVLLLVLAGVVTMLLQARSDRLNAARDRTLAAAESFAHAPGLVATLRGPDPSSVLQPLTEAARKAGSGDFIVVMNKDGIRYTHPKPELIGKRVIGNIAPALAGRVTVESIHGGPYGEEVQAIVPVKDASGTVAGLVASGLKLSRVSSAVGHLLPLVLGAGAATLALATGGTALMSRRLRRQTHGLGPAELARMYEHHDAVLHAVREGVVIVDDKGCVVLVNDEARRLLNLPSDAEKRPADSLGLDPRTTDLLVSRQEASDEVLPAGERLLAVNVRPTDGKGGPSGTVATLRDTTELRALAGKAEAASGRLQLLYGASMAIGTTLDVQRTAEELTEATAPGFSDYTTVDLADAVLHGDEPQLTATDDAQELSRVALNGIQDNPPLRKVGEQTTIAGGADLLARPAMLVSDLRQEKGWHTQDAERAEEILNHGMRSLITVPLRARGMLMGTVTFWRTERRDPFEPEDMSLAEELAARAAVCVDNARRFTREHAMAVTLQHSLLPRGLPEQNAVEVAHRYLPAQAGVGGDWFDVIALPGARVALVVGDVVGHGLHAAATMGRLRTAVLNFSSLDLPPDELLSYLDELVARIDQETEGEEDEPAVTGATCLYAIYDPASGVCTFARAGHPLPAVVRPDGTVEFPELPAGPPLGLGGLPFEATDVHLPGGSSLVLYTDGLITDRAHEANAGLEILTTALGHPGRTPEETCEAVLDSLLPAHQSDDIALLIARTRIMDPSRIALWDIPSDPAAVATARADATRQLIEWGLDEMVFTTELILSELVTNAIRYGTGPIRMRLLHDRRLICEVSDTSSTSAHLRYAADEDEGGRGLFLVAQLAERWGTRYTANGKVIWAEQGNSSDGGTR